MGGKLGGSEGVRVTCGLMVMVTGAVVGRTKIGIDIDIDIDMDIDMVVEMDALDPSRWRVQAAAS
jgi:hypothetical protein